MFIGTCDKVRIAGSDGVGRYYSDKTPLLSLYGAVVYRLGGVFGFDARVDLAAVYRWVTFFLVVLPGLWIFYWIGRWPGLSALGRSWLAAGAVFGTLVLPYSMVLNSYIAAAACLVGAWVLLREEDLARDSGGVSVSGWACGRCRLAWAGLLLGLAASIELSLGVFLISFSVYCAWRFARENRFGVAAFAGAAALPILISFFVYWQLSGELKPVNLQIERYLYPGSIQKPEYLLGGTPASELTLGSVLLILWHGWFGYKGVFSHSVIVLLGFVGLVRMARVGAGFGLDAWRPEALAILAPVGASALTFALDATHYYGGFELRVSIHGSVDAVGGTLRGGTLGGACGEAGSG